jgi:hypothetical protein
MKRLISATLAAFLLGGTIAVAAPSQGKSRKHAKQERAKYESSPAHVAVHVVFTSSEVTIIRHHYAPEYRNLPPGLQKKVARGGSLPPGWQKKMRPFPVDLERRLPVLPLEYRRGVFDGHAVIYNTRSNVIVDVAVLF